MRKGTKKKPLTEVSLNYKCTEEESSNRDYTEAFQPLFERAEALYWAKKLKVNKNKI